MSYQHPRIEHPPSLLAAAAAASASSTANGSARRILARSRHDPRRPDERSEHEKHLFTCRFIESGLDTGIEIDEMTVQGAGALNCLRPVALGGSGWLRNISSTSLGSEWRAGWFRCVGARTAAARGGTGPSKGGDSAGQDVAHPACREAADRLVGPPFECLAPPRSVRSAFDPSVRTTILL